MSLVLNILEFWISHNSEYARILNMPLVVSMIGFWICLWFSRYQCSEYARFTQGPEYAWICLKNSWICLIMPGSVWVAFVFHVPVVITCLLECIVIYLNKVYSLKEHEAVFLRRQNLIYSVVAGSTWFVFCFRLNNFTSNIQIPIRSYFLGPRGQGLLVWYTIIKHQKN